MSATGSSAIRHLSPVEAARALGVSVRALRLYERRGLVAPLRTGNGWRVYGEAEIARLHQVLALKGLGLPLARIASLLSGRAIGLDGVLALQEEALAAEQDRLHRALGLVRSARKRLAAGQTLSIDDLTTLAKETTMSHDDMKAIFDPLTDKHFDKADLDTLAARNFGVDQQTEATDAWAVLTADARAVMAKGDPTSPEAMDLARRWQAQVEKFTQGDPGLFAKAGAMWKDAMNGPDAHKLPMDNAMFAFIAQATAAWKAGEG